MLASWEKLPLWNSFCSCYYGHFSCSDFPRSKWGLCFDFLLLPDGDQFWKVNQAASPALGGSKTFHNLTSKKKRERERVHRLGTVTWWTLIPVLEKSGVGGQELVAGWWRGKGEGGLERCLEASDSRMRLSVSWGPADEEGSLLIHHPWKGSLVFSAIPKLLVLCSSSYTDEFVSAGVEGSGSGGRQCS